MGDSHSPFARAIRMLHSHTHSYSFDSLEKTSALMAMNGSLATVGAMRSTRSRVVSAVCAALVGCAAGPDYVRPEIALPQSFKEAPDEKSGAWQPARPNDAAARGAWWSVFSDGQLDALEIILDALRGFRHRHKVTENAAVAQATGGTSRDSRTTNAHTVRYTFGPAAMISAETPWNCSKFFTNLPAKSFARRS